VILPDTNLLLYAFRPEFPGHGTVRSWMQAQVDSGEIFAVHPLSFAAFLRLSTRPLGALPPAPVETAIRFLIALDGARIAEATNHSRVLSRLCAAHRIQGDGIVDAWLAAFAITHGMRLASHDRGFSRFVPELEWIDPLAV
jgi:toxin-antitoxin system PIN domain toxin